MMFITSNENVRVGKMYSPPISIKKKYDKFLQSYNNSLFAYWNYELEKWQVFEKGKSGSYLVMTIEDDIDYRVITELESRNIQKNLFRRKSITEDVDNHNDDHEYLLDKKMKDESWNISMDIFNRVMENPVIQGG